MLGSRDVLARMHVLCVCVCVCFPRNGDEGSGDDADADEKAALEVDVPLSGSPGLRARTHPPTQPPPNQLARARRGACVAPVRASIVIRYACLRSWFKVDA
uniref:Secreted protein n=1 Tax=Mesocestoides corti TaxID=53468 RepID=A0A5K3ERE9_MESCO